MPNVEVSFEGCQPFRRPSEAPSKFCVNGSQLDTYQILLSGNRVAADESLGVTSQIAFASMLL